MSNFITLTGGLFQDAEGNALANGFIAFQLAFDAEVAGVPCQTVAGPKIIFSLNSSGNVSSPQIRSNAEFSTPGSYYLVMVMDANGANQWRHRQKWTFTQSAGSTVDLGSFNTTQLEGQLVFSNVFQSAEMLVGGLI